MKALAGLLVVVALSGASLAVAEGDSDTPADVAAQRALRERNADEAARARMGGFRECWNPQTRQFEVVEEGRPQRELDVRRCHLVPEANRAARRDPGTPLAYEPRYRGPSPELRGPFECWNSRARHYEGVRPGETQDDLDFTRCRIPR